MGNLPKILVVSEEPFNWENGTGITLSNIFKGWDIERIANVYFTDRSAKKSEDICTKFYRLNRFANLPALGLRVLMLPILKRNIKMELPHIVPLSASEKSFQKKMLLNYLAGAELSPLIISGSLWKWVKEYNPDMIYSMLGNGRVIKLTNLIASKANKPILPHFTDDWPDCIYTQNEWMGVARTIFNHELQKLFSRSKHGLCISDQMTKEYIKRYKIPFTTVLNCVEDDFFVPPQQLNTETEPIVFVFTGWLHLNRWKSLLEIAEAIEAINKNGFNAQLHIYCPEVNRASFSEKFNHLRSTRFMGSVSSAQVSEVLRLASVLVHVESFKENIIQYTKLSLSTKIPQYMASNKPILAYGPSQLASIQHIVNTNAGYAITSNNRDEMKKKIQTLIENKELRLSFANNGYIFAKENHSQSKTHERLRSVFLAYNSVN